METLLAEQAHGASQLSMLTCLEGASPELMTNGLFRPTVFFKPPATSSMPPFGPDVFGSAVASNASCLPQLYSLCNRRGSPSFLPLPAHLWSHWNALYGLGQLMPQTTSAQTFPTNLTTSGGAVSSAVTPSNSDAFRISRTMHPSLSCNGPMRFSPYAYSKPSSPASSGNSPDSPR